MRVASNVANRQVRRTKIGCPPGILHKHKCRSKGNKLTYIDHLSAALSSLPSGWIKGIINVEKLIKLVKSNASKHNFVVGRAANTYVQKAIDNFINQGYFVTVDALHITIAATTLSIVAEIEEGLNKALSKVQRYREFCECFREHTQSFWPVENNVTFNHTEDLEGVDIVMQSLSRQTSVADAHDTGSPQPRTEQNHFGYPTPKLTPHESQHSVAGKMIKPFAVQISPLQLIQERKKSATDRSDQHFTWDRMQIDGQTPTQRTSFNVLPKRMEIDGTTPTPRQTIFPPSVGLSDILPPQSARWMEIDGYTPRSLHFSRQDKDILAPNVNKPPEMLLKTGASWFSAQLYDMLEWMKETRSQLKKVQDDLKLPSQMHAESSELHDGLEAQHQQLIEESDDSTSENAQLAVQMVNSGRLIETDLVIRAVELENVLAGIKKDIGFCVVELQRAREVEAAGEAELYEARLLLERISKTSGGAASVEAIQTQWKEVAVNWINLAAHRIETIVMQDRVMAKLIDVIGGEELEEAAGRLAECAKAQEERKVYAGRLLKNVNTSSGYEANLHIMRTSM